MNITVKAHCIKAVYSEHTQQEFEKIRIIARRDGVCDEVIFNKIADMQYTLAGISLYRL